MSDRSRTIILYGSYGYTGRLIAHVCLEKKLPVILGGRNERLLRRQHHQTGYPFEVVDISNTAALEHLLLKGAVVIHCAGPFQFTSKAMVEACLRTGTHYTDIAGEYQVFEMLAGFDSRAKEKAITILPGTGFDVVPSDCLALHLKQRLPSATHLQLAFHMSKGGLSRGTSRTMIEGLGEGSMIRVDGTLKNIPLGQKSIDVDFGSFKASALNIPWGDIATAWRSTAIPNIEVYMSVPRKMIARARLARYVNWLMRRRWVKNFLLKKIDRRPDGPSDERRRAGRSFLWGKAWDDQGKGVVTTLESLNGYSLTAQTSVLIAAKILQGKFVTGYQTPATAYGADLILEIGETHRVDRE